MSPTKRSGLVSAEDSAKPGPGSYAQGNGMGVGPKVSENILKINSIQSMAKVKIVDQVIIQVLEVMKMLMLMLEIKAQLSK